MSDSHAIPARENPAHADASHGHPDLAHHFVDLTQQRESAELGMWLFLVTEIMFFGGLFLAYLVYRHWHHEGFAVGSATMDVMLGTINTTVLLTSSLTMALAVQAAQQSQRQRLIWLLVATIVLGTIFLGIKGYEYHHKHVEHLIPFAGFPFRYAGPDQGGVAAFLNLYFVMTGLHAFHMVIGIGILLTLVVLARRGGMVGERSIVVYNTGLYWHFVDLVWVYLFPFFYLVAGT